MKIINSILFYINVIGISAFFVAMAVIGIAYYLLNVKKIAAHKENINTSYFKKEDAISYAMFKDLVSKDGTNEGDGMLAITDASFTGALSVRGFDYATASMDEKVDAIVNSVAFSYIIDRPLAFRQSVSAIDLSPNIEIYKEASKKWAYKSMELEMEYNATVVAADDYIDDVEMYSQFQKRMDELQKEIYATRHKYEECEVLLKYMDAMSGDTEQKKDFAGERTAQIMFSYDYNPNESSVELSKEEIYLKAQNQIDAIANSYIDALGACHFKAKRMSYSDIFRLLYKHFHPITGEDMSIDELLEGINGNYIISSNSLVEVLKEKLGEEMYQQKMQEIQKKMQEMIKTNELQQTRKVEMIREQSFDKALQELTERSVTEG